MSVGWVLLGGALTGVLIGLCAGAAILRRRKRKAQRMSVSLGYSALWDEDAREWQAQEGEGAHVAVVSEDS